MLEFNIYECLDLDNSPIVIGMAAGVVPEEEAVIAQEDDANGKKGKKAAVAEVPVPPTENNCPSVLIALRLLLPTET